jgi:hypothetical protein
MAPDRDAEALRRPAKAVIGGRERGRARRGEYEVQAVIDRMPELDGAPGNPIPVADLLA